MLLKHFWPLYHRARFYADLPQIALLLKFKDLRARYYREMWQKAAAETGASFSDLGQGFGRISRSGLTTYVKHGEVMLDSHLMLDLMGNKPLTRDILMELGVPVPRALGFAIGDLASAEKFLAGLGRPVAIKPASGTGGGRGVTAGVCDVAALRAAARYAARFGSGGLMAEEFIQGESYRLLYLGGEFIDAVHRQSPTLVGDGRSTIRQLVRAENARRLAGRPVTALSPLKIDRDCEGKLRQQGFTTRRVLAEGEVIQLKQAVNENGADRNHSVKSRVHPATVALGAEIVRRIGVSFAGLDLICRDIAAPLDQANGCFNEVNTTPGIHHHCLIANPAEAVPVARLVLEHMFRSGAGVMRLDPAASRARAA